MIRVGERKKSGCRLLKLGRRRKRQESKYTKMWDEHDWESTCQPGMDAWFRK